MTARERSNAPDGERRRLILLEQGASLPDQNGELFDETTIIAQLPGEGAAAFAERVLHHIAASERSKHRFSEAVICTSGAVDPDIVAARRSIALGVDAHATSSKLPAS